MSEEPPTGFVATDSQSRHLPRDIERLRQGIAESTTDTLAIEEPLEIRLKANAIEERPLAITMRTPGNDHELALGFLYGEGIIESSADIELVEHCRPPSPDKGIHNTICVTLKAGVSFDLDSLDRHFYTSSSCGVCGKTSIEQVMGKRIAEIPTTLQISEDVVRGLAASLRDRQTDFAKSGGIHAAGLITSNGDITVVREDIGRHNAVDKLIGHALLNDALPLRSHGIILSGRAGFELVQKAAMSGIELIAGIGPPSSLSVELADKMGISLAGFVNAQGFNIYCHPLRIRFD